MSNDTRGLYRKFRVVRMKDENTGEEIDDAFVLRPEKELAARAALRTYAEYTDNYTLADDLYEALDRVANGYPFYREDYREA